MAAAKALAKAEADLAVITKAEAVAAASQMIERFPNSRERDRALNMRAEALLAKDQEIADLKDRVLRSLADLENTRRRLERDKAEATQYAVTSFARDMLAVADFYARKCSGLFSLEMWGGATFDTAMRFLNEDPWLRLRALRQAVPNICFQNKRRLTSSI